MLNFIKTQILSLSTGFNEFIYSIAEKVDYRMKEFKINFRSKLVDRDLEKVFMKLGQKGLSYYQKGLNFPKMNLSMFEPELIKIQVLKDKYSQSLLELSKLQRRALKESLSECSQQFNRTGWGLVQINVPEFSRFRGRKITELLLKDDILILMVKKDNKIELAHGNTHLGGGDALICIGTDAGLDSLNKLLNQSDL